MSDPGPRAPGPTQIDEDLSCTQCGYNLRTLPANADCPECGQSVEYSVGLGAVKRWPLNAERPCSWMCLGLLLTLCLGVGLPVWAIGVHVLVIRMPPQSAPWAFVRHATWVTMCSTFTTIGLVLFLDMFTYRHYQWFVLLFVVSTLGHFICIFLLAIRITSDAKMPLARGFAISCLALQVGVLPVPFFSAPYVLESATIGLLFCAATWTVVGAFYWLGVSVTLGYRREALERKAKRGLGARALSQLSAP